MRSQAGNAPFFPEIWGRAENRLRTQGFSVAIHSLAALLLVVPVFRTPVNELPPSKGLLSGRKLFFPTGGGGGGGEHNPIAATAGKAPIFSRTQFTPPAILRNPTPKLPAEATLLGEPAILVPDVRFANTGDPSMSMLTGSAGPGARGGYGTGCCGGDGPGNGKGLGPGYKWGTSGGEPGPIAKGTVMPECVYCPNPTFSDEARKTKTQGTVMLRLVVTPDGRAERISVVKGLGLGLDERAIEAVRTWRFRPALEFGGRLVPVWVTVEVTFRLL